MFGLAPVRRVRPRQAEQSGDLIVRGLRQRVSAPAERPRAGGRCADGVPGIELAITKSALAIFPRFAPGNGAESQEKAAGRQTARGWIDRPLLQHMRQWRIMIERGLVADAAERVEDEIGLGRMQIAARGIVAQRPRRSLEALPGADAEGKLQKQAKRFKVEKRGAAGRAVGEGRRPAVVGQWQCDLTGALEQAIGRGLRRPVKKGGPQRIAVRRMFGAPVIAANIGRQGVVLTKVEASAHPAEHLAGVGQTEHNEGTQTNTLPSAGPGAAGLTGSPPRPAPDARRDAAACVDNARGSGAAAPFWFCRPRTRRRTTPRRRSRTRRRHSPCRPVRC